MHQLRGSSSWLIATVVALLIAVTGNNGVLILVHGDSLSSLPPTACQPNLGTNNQTCSALIRICLLQWNIKLKWTDAGKSGIGCRCDQYCGYPDALSCDKDPQCVWKKTGKKTGACFNQLTGEKGREITICPIWPFATPSRSPTMAKPTSTPSWNPSMAPTTSRPTADPNADPSLTPSLAPSYYPSTVPSLEPTTSKPSSNPSTHPSPVPSHSPTTSTPSFAPSLEPTTSKPSLNPSSTPSLFPTTSKPSSSPSLRPSSSPSHSPTSSIPSSSPSLEPTTSKPTSGPSSSPSHSPTTSKPSSIPSANPTLSPTHSPTTSAPSYTPSHKPTTSQPTSSPSSTPSRSPTSSKPTGSPSTSPTVSPTSNPSVAPTTSTPTLSPSTSIPTSSPIRALRAVQIACSFYYSCAVTTTGAAVCWGSNGNGNLGNSNTADSNVPVHVTGLTSGVTSISTGAYHACAVQNGAAKCWGYNYFGQLGDNTGIQRSSPVQVVGLTSGVTQVRCGQYHSCALLTDKTVKCWGYNGYGQLGNGNFNTQLTPFAVVGLANVDSISLGFYHTCATTQGATQTWCWGWNGNGQLGLGLAPQYVVVPTRMIFDFAGGSVSTLSAWAPSSTCAVNGTGAALCVGTDNTFNSYRPIAFSGLTSDVVCVSANLQNVGCAVQSSGQCKCWGNNGNGQLGIGTTVSYPFPVAVSGDQDHMQVSVGFYHVCSIRKNTNAVTCWGWNGNGQVGNGAIGGDWLTPVYVVPA